MEKKLEILKLSIPAISELSARKLLGGDGYGFPNEDELPKDWGNNPLDEVIETEKQSNGWNNINSERDEDWHQENDWDMDESLDDGFENDTTETEDIQAHEENLLKNTIEKLPQTLKDFIKSSHLVIKIDLTLNKGGEYNKKNNTTSLINGEKDGLVRELIHAYQAHLGTAETGKNHATTEFQERAFGDLMAYIDTLTGIRGYTCKTVNPEDELKWDGFIQNEVLDKNGVVNLDVWEKEVTNYFDEYQERYEGDPKYDGSFNKDFDFHWNEFFDLFGVEYKTEQKQQ